MSHTLNPINKKYAIYDSKIHWAKNCLQMKGENKTLTEESLDDGEQDSSTEEVNIVLMTEEISGHEIFPSEKANSAVEDTGCIKVVPWGS